MKRLFYLIICTFFATMTIFAQDTLPAEWEPVSEEPLATAGESGTWNSVYNEPGDVVYIDGEYHLFTTGFPGFPAESGIGYLISDDGINYEWVSEDPIIKTEDVPYAEVAIDTGSVIVEEDGTWVLYFTVFNSANWPRIAGTIGRATTDDPAGTWEISEAPILEASGEEGAWDEAMVAYPTVLQMDDGYRMYFVGQDAEGAELLGMATSEDGITWEKETDPVFEPEGAINFMINQVVFDGERYLLAYKNSYDSISVVSSEDGLSWDVADAVETLSPADFDAFVALGFISLTVVERPVLSLV